MARFEIFTCRLSAAAAAPSDGSVTSSGSFLFGDCVTSDGVVSCCTIADSNNCAPYVADCIIRSNASAVGGLPGPDEVPDASIITR